MDLKLKKALFKDFENLYQKEYCTDFKEKRLIRSVEIGIMDLTNVKKLFNDTVQPFKEALQVARTYLLSPVISHDIGTCWRCGGQYPGSCHMYCPRCVKIMIDDALFSPERKGD